MKSFNLFAAIFCLMSLPMQSAFAEELKLKNKLNQKLDARIKSKCDVNDIWGSWDLTENRKGTRVLTVKGTYYTCKSHCNCGGYMCTNAFGKKYAVATSCEDINF